MNFIAAWAIAISSPSMSDFVFMNTLFETELACEVAVTMLVVEKPTTISCHQVAVMVPKKPTDV